MGLNAVQTLIPWFMMEPTPGAFVTDGFVDIVRFAKLCDKHGLKIVLRPGPFICDGPDFGARSCLCEMMLSSAAEPWHCGCCRRAALGAGAAGDCRDDAPRQPRPQAPRSHLRPGLHAPCRPLLH